ncbi:hypothetical protein C1H46_032054 [Malus baccata]|uniref:Uncharacterized protein n=1 Tax=Malus baccata TaxID=106549 RepID=A0A540L822_MALBA|nr:hypothetical protein C1H46_032054 [Malus baccata]
MEKVTEKLEGRNSNMSSPADLSSWNTLPKLKRLNQEEISHYKELNPTELSPKEHLLLLKALCGLQAQQCPFPPKLNLKFFCF